MEEGIWTLEEGSMKTQSCAHPQSHPLGNTPHASKWASPAPRVSMTGLEQFPVCRAQRERGELEAPWTWQRRMSLRDESPLLRWHFCLTRAEPANADFPQQNAWREEMSWLCLRLFHLLGHKVPEVTKNPWGCLKPANTTGTSIGEKMPLQVHTIWICLGLTAAEEWRAHSDYGQLCQVKSGLNDPSVTRVKNKACIGDKPGPLWGEVDLEVGSWYYFGKVLLIVRKNHF